MTAAVQPGLQLCAIGVTLTAARGPALAGGFERGIAISIMSADGSPITGLSGDAFSTALLFDGTSRATARNGSLAAVNEPMPGVYVLRLDLRGSPHSSDALACVIDVRTGQADSRGGGRSRILVPLDG